MTKKVRVRFAPSPTGYLHLGGARTALYAWLWARRNGGEMVLRIEDTDRERSTDENVRIVLDSLRWLGLDWDEGPEVGGPRGPYFQTERVALYAEHAQKLIANGHAYRCYASKEDIAAQRAEFEAQGKKGFKFRSPWRDRQEEREAPHVIRFRAPTEGKTGWDDLVKGHIEYPNVQQYDQILVRENGIPTYNFGCVVDDLTMGITLVTRGDDHMVNTPIQILLYRALGATVPEMAHLPMILGPDGKKLSKRNTQVKVAVLEYRDAGYLPDALVNYLARLGWSHGDQEVFARDELIAKFDWTHVGTSGAKYDLKKLDHVQGEHLRMLDDRRIAELARPFVTARGLEVDAADPKLVGAIEHVKLRATTLENVAEDVDYFFRDDSAIEYEEKGKRKFLRPDVADNLRSLASLCESVEPFDVPTLDESVRTWMESEKLSFKDYAQSARVALTGRTRSPGLFEVMAVLGRAATVARLRRGADAATAG
jgi:glutamyl-tRNA synthetase